MSPGSCHILPIQELRGQTLRCRGCRLGRHLMTARLVCFICSEMDAQPQIKHSKWFGKGQGKGLSCRGAKVQPPWELRNFPENVLTVEFSARLFDLRSWAASTWFRPSLFSEGSVSVFNRNANPIPFPFDGSWHLQGNPIITCVWDRL